MLYELAAGRRRKDRNPDWVHSMLKRTGQLPENFVLRQCLFGQHLLAKAPHTPIAIVEAEKTAVIADIFESVFPEIMWLASGGKSVLTIPKLELVGFGRPILLYPDADAYESWERLASAARQRGIDVRVSTLVQNLADKIGDAGGLDLADCLLEIRAQKNLRRESDDALLEYREERLAIMTIDGGVSEEAARAYLRHPFTDR